VLLAAVTLAPRPAAASLPPRPAYDGLVLLMEDDFDGYALNPAVWTAPPNYVQTQYDITCFNAVGGPPTVLVAGGELHLLTRTLPAPALCACAACPGASPRPFSLTSGWVDTQDTGVAARDGLVEVRARLPPASFKIWPAAWLLSARSRRDQGVCWPLASELDIYEVAGGFDARGGLGANALCASAHYGDRCFVDLGAGKTGCVPAARLAYSEGWHTYAVRWTRDDVKWFIDGEVIHIATVASDPDLARGGLPFKDAMALILETSAAWWIAPQDGAPGLPADGAPLVHAFDWVRMWTAAP
jgi:hypothetical protein